MPVLCLLQAKRLLSAVLVNILDFLGVGLFNFVDDAEQLLVNNQHGSTVVKLAAVVLGRENSQQLAIGMESKALFLDLNM